MHELRADGHLGCVQGLPTDFNGWSALVVKWLSYVEEISPFKVGNIQKLIADVSKDAYVPPRAAPVGGVGVVGWGVAGGGPPCRAVSCARALAGARAAARSRPPRCPLLSPRGVL